MNSAANDYANGPASYAMYGNGWIRESTVVLQRGCRDLNEDNGRACLESFALVSNTTETTSATEAAEILTLAQKIAEEIGDSDEVHGAASKLQAIQRKKQAKKEAERKREEKRIADEIGNSEEVHSAASKLQAIQRAKRAKQEVSKLKEEAGMGPFNPRTVAKRCETHILRSTGPAIDTQKFIKMDMSTSGTKSLVLRHVNEKSIVEVVHSNTSNNTTTNETPYNYRIDASAIHGKPLGDGWFAASGGSAFSPDERYAVYVACDKNFTGAGGHPGGGAASGIGGKSYFDIPKSDSSADNTPNTMKYENNDDWGERYTDVHATVLAVVDTFTGNVVTIPFPKSDIDDKNGYTVGQPTWQPFATDAGEPRYVLAFTQWAHNATEQDTKLGMIYCYQRPCSVRLVDVTHFLAAHSKETSTASITTTTTVNDLELKDWQLPVFSNLTGSTLRNARSPRFCPEVNSVNGDPSAMLVCVGRTHQQPLVTHGGSFQLFRCHYVWKSSTASIDDDDDEKLKNDLAKEMAEAAAEFGDSDEVHDAASKLQAIQRKKQAKKEAERKREEKRIADEIGDSEEVHSAASKLQAIQRAKSAKAHVNKIRNDQGGAKSIAIYVVLDLLVRPSASTCMPLLGDTDVSVDITNESFPGLFIDQLPKRCFIRLSSTSNNDESQSWAIVCTTTWGSRNSAVRIDLDTGKVHRMTSLLTSALPSWPTSNTWNDNQHSSCSVFDVDCGTGEEAMILFEASSPTVPQRAGLLLYDPNKHANSTRIDIPIAPRCQLIYTTKDKAKSNVLSSKLESMKWRIFTHLPSTSKGKATSSNHIPFESILIMPPPATQEDNTTAATVATSVTSQVVDTGAAQSPVKATAISEDKVDSASLAEPVDGSLPSLQAVGSAVQFIQIASASTPVKPNSPQPSASTPRSGKHTPGYTSAAEVSDSSGIPLLLVPHGGPHGCTPTCWVPAYAYLAMSLGAAVLHVNYRGSLGFGQASVDSLPGHIGTNDVADMMQALHEVCASINANANNSNSEDNVTIDMNKICVVGGSHGGFLSAHLTGQHPEAFVSCALRNPVTNLPSMASITDIPDWCHIEAKGLGSAPSVADSTAGSGTAVTVGGVVIDTVNYNIYNSTYSPKAIDTGKITGTYDFQCLSNNVLSDSDLQLMRACSPIAHIGNVKTSTLTVLGAKDRRVPYSNGIEWHRILRSKGVRSKMMIFPKDVHSIDSPCSEAEHWVAIKHWFEEDIKNASK